MCLKSLLLHSVDRPWGLWYVKSFFSRRHWCATNCLRDLHISRRKHCSLPQVPPHVVITTVAFFCRRRKRNCSRKALWNACNIAHPSYANIVQLKTNKETNIRARSHQNNTSANAETEFLPPAYVVWEGNVFNLFVCPQKGDNPLDNVRDRGSRQDQGVSPPPPPRKTRVWLAMPRVVRLLRSRRRTFLFLWCLSLYNVNVLLIKVPKKMKIM